MNTNNTFKSKEESLSLNFQDSNLKVNRNTNSSTSHLISTSKREISGKTNNSIKQFGEGSLLAQPKDNTPRLEVSVDFAASQWFQILLIHINSRNKKLSGVLEPIGGCQFNLNG